MWDVFPGFTEPGSSLSTLLNVRRCVLSLVEDNVRDHIIGPRLLIREKELQFCYIMSRCKMSFIGKIRAKKKICHYPAAHLFCEYKCNYTSSNINDSNPYVPSKLLICVSLKLTHLHQSVLNPFHDFLPENFSICFPPAQIEI